SSSGESESRARWATYLMSISLFIELPPDEGFELGQRLGSIVAVRVDGQFTAGAGGQHHQTHDALAVDLLAILFHKDLAIKPTGGFDKESCWPGMNAQLVGHQKVLRHY